MSKPARLFFQLILKYNFTHATHHTVLTSGSDSQKCAILNRCIFTWERDVRAAIFPVAAGTHPPSRALPGTTPLSGQTHASHPGNARMRKLIEITAHFTSPTLLCKIGIFFYNQTFVCGVSFREAVEFG